MATGTGWKPVEHLQCLAGSTPAPSALSFIRQLFRGVNRVTFKEQAFNKKESHSIRCDSLGSIYFSDRRLSGWRSCVRQPASVAAVERRQSLLPLDRPESKPDRQD